MKEFFVKGGTYESTSFAKIVAGKIEKGPFKSYEEAYACWETLSWQNADDCLMRFEIISK